MRRWTVVALTLGTLVGAIAPGTSKELPRGGTAAHTATGCEAFGPGFQKVEGTDTCIKVSGSVRIETGVSTGAASVWPGARR